MYDIIIQNGTLIDGTRAPRYRADLGIQKDCIRHIGDLQGQEAGQFIDAQGKIVAPGFVDVHNHSDAWLFKVPNLLPKTLQGFTTEAIMVDGISYAPVDAHTRHEWIHYLRPINGLRFEEYQDWESLADYMSLIEGRSAQNAICHIPYGNIRSLACGFGRQAPDDFQMSQILGAVEQGMAEGAVGISTGMDYISQCHATTDELVEASAVMAAQKGLYATHIRYRKGLMGGLKEAVEIGRRADVPVHISHLKATTPENTDILLTYLDEVATQEVDFSFDVYPYLPGSTMLGFFLPYEVWEDGPLSVLPKLRDPRIRRQFARDLPDIRLERMRLAWLSSEGNRQYLGKTLGQYVEEVGRPPEEAICDLLIEENLAVLMVTHHGDDTLAHPFLAHDCFMLGTDGVYFPDGVVHPRVYGSAPRILGPCVRDHKLFSLEDAVYKLSGYPSARFGLANRGTLQEGHFADIVVFDAENIADRATFENPHQYSVGVEHVLVNGVPIVREGRAVEDLPAPLPGRYLKFKQ